MSESVKFLRNAWYVAALSTEVDDSVLFSRVILNTPVLIYRKHDGQPVALHDRCPHRFAPLSIGSREGDDIICRYHGLRFDCSGSCVESPHGNCKIPAAARVREFVLVERDGFLWIWPGDSEKADPSQILDCSMLTRQPASSVAYAYMHNAANYELITDNIMDLTHIDHLHGPLINTRGKLSPLTPAISEESDGIRIRWDWHADPAMQLLAMNFDDPELPAEQYFEVKWHAPSNLTLNLGALQGDGDYEKDGLVLYDYHIMTPETETTTHYFFASTRNYKLDDEEYNTMKMAGMIEAFSLEDKPVIEKQQAIMGTPDLWELNPVLLPCDAGAVRVRRRLQQMIEGELA